MFKNVLDVYIIITFSPLFVVVVRQANLNVYWNDPAFVSFDLHFYHALMQLFSYWGEKQYVKETKRYEPKYGVLTFRNGVYLYWQGN